MPPPLVMLACAGLAWGLAQVEAYRFGLPGAGAVGTALVLAGIMLNLLPKLAFARAGTTVNPLQPDRTTRLVRSGLHRWSRNPMYLGHAVILLGIALALRNALAFTALPVYVLYVSRFQILPEERALLARFGGEYADYCRHVRRWI